MTLCTRKVLGAQTQVADHEADPSVGASGSACLQEHFAKFPSRYPLSVAARDVIVHMKLMDETSKTNAVAVYAEAEGAEPNQKVRAGSCVA